MPELPEKTDRSTTPVIPSLAGARQHQGRALRRHLGFVDAGADVVVDEQTVADLDVTAVDQQTCPAVEGGVAGERRVSEDHPVVVQAEQRAAGRGRVGAEHLRRRHLEIRQQDQDGAADGLDPGPGLEVAVGEDHMVELHAGAVVGGGAVLRHAVAVETVSVTIDEEAAALLGGVGGGAEAAEQQRVAEMELGRAAVEGAESGRRVGEIRGGDVDRAAGGYVCAGGLAPIAPEDGPLDFDQSPVALDRAAPGGDVLVEP